MLPLQSNKSKSKYSSFTMKSISITQLSGVVQKNFLELCLWQLPQFLKIQQGLDCTCKQYILQAVDKKLHFFLLFL